LETLSSGSSAEQSPESPEDSPARARVSEQIEWYDRKSRTNQHWFKGLKICQIVTAAAIPVAASVSAPVWMVGGGGTTLRWNGTTITSMSSGTTRQLAGVWSSMSSWKRRMGLAHLLSLGLVMWGLALAAGVVLPRIGYANQSAAWFCPEPK